MKEKRAVVIEVLGGCVVEVWSEDGSVEEAIIVDHDEKKIGRVAVAKGIPDSVLEMISKGGAVCDG